jgi:ornithine carbamoyltransferase
MASLKGRDMLSLKDFNAEELRLMFKMSEDLKARLAVGDMPDTLYKKTLGLIFQRHSTRTHIQFETAMTQMGGHGIYLTPEQLQLAKGETWEDTGRVLSKYMDGIAIRWFQDVAEKLAEWASVPVINASTDYSHPTQAIAELMTMKEKKGKLEGVNLTYAWGLFTKWAKPPGYLNDILWAGSKLGMNITMACPEGYELKDTMEESREDAEKSGGRIRVVHDLKEGVKGADVIISRSWVPTAKEYKQSPDFPHTKHPEKFKEWLLDARVMSLAKKDAIVMHALPAVKGEELTEEVFEGPHSAIFDEADNGLHAKKGILALLLGQR